jgi:pimeloyl-ACP methyl ester carboxylesterase
MRIRAVLGTGLAGALLVPVLWLFGPAPGDRSEPAATQFDGGSVLVYDQRGDGRIAQAVGDLATADRIAVLVPGVDNTLANFAAGLGNVTRRSPLWQATQVYREAEALAPGAKVAVVAWLGYDAPEGISRDALREERAAAGARALVRFVADLAAYRPAADITVVGHSYGSVVTGLAAHSLSSHVRDLISVASPGMGVERAADLRTRARLWAGAAAADWIRRVPGLRIFGAGHGTLPTDPSFGARTLPVDGVAGHDGYFVPGTGSLRAIASIVVSGASQAGRPAAE